MSITKQTTTVKAAAAILYAHYGRPVNVNGSRVAGWRSDFKSPWDAITSIESMLKGSGRKNQALMVIQSFSADELDPSDPSTPHIVADAAYALAKEVAPNSPCDVVVHLDSQGGNPHAHITIANVDLVSGRAAREDGLAHWVLKRANDKVMRQMGLEVLKPADLAHDVNRVRSRSSVEGLSVDDLDRGTWREFLAERVDEALIDPRSVDFDSLCKVAREYGVSIAKKTSAKSEAEGRDPSLTYALVDEDDQVRTFGRSKAACTSRKLGADYSWQSVHNTINERMIREQELEDVKSFGEDECELNTALASLREADDYRGHTSYRGRVTDEVKQTSNERRERIELSDANLSALATRLANERYERDQADAQRAKQDADRDRANRERQARRESVERRKRQQFRPESLFYDDYYQQDPATDDFEFG